MLDLRLRRPIRGGRSYPGSYPGADTGSGGGTTVRVGSTTQTGYLLHDSMVMRLNSFDFRLKNPVTVPVVGDMVYVLEPAWDGQIVSVSWDDIPVGSDRFYTVTATNAKVATLSTSSINLSDTPDLASTYPYSDLRITYSKDDNGNKTRGICKIRKGEGLWPLQTFTLTSVHFGFVAQPFTCSNVTVTWPVDLYTRWFDVEFGDALLGLTELAVNTGGLSTNADGTTSLRDPLGNLIFNSGTGFGAAWRRFLTSGVYNGDWAAGPPDPSNVIINVTNPIPSWSFLRIGGTGINAQWISDPSQGSGYVLRFTMSPGVADDQVVLEQLVPINASRNRAYSYRVRAYFFNGSASASPGGLISLEHQYMRKDGSSTTGAAVSNTVAVTSATDMITELIPSVVPADAYFIRVRVGLKRDTALVGTTASVDLAEVRLEGGIGTALMIPDDPDPATNGVGVIWQQNKILELVSGYGSAAGTRGTIRLNGSYLKMYTAAHSTGSVAFPTTPTPLTDDLYYRTDLDMWFFYDGTRWLSTTLYTQTIEGQKAVMPFAASTVLEGLFPHPTMSIYVEQYWGWFFVQVPSSGTQYWTAALAATGVTLSTISNTADTWTQETGTVNAVLAPQILYISVTKVSTAGGLDMSCGFTYRLVAT